MSRSTRYWRAVFEGEDGDIVKNLLTDGQWKPNSPGGSDYKPDTMAVKIVGTIMAVIIIGAVGFGTWKLLVWAWLF